MKKVVEMAAVALVLFFVLPSAMAGSYTDFNPSPCGRYADWAFGCQQGFSQSSFGSGSGYSNGQDVGLVELVTLPARLDLELARLKAEIEYWKALKRAYKNSQR